MEEAFLEADKKITDQIFVDISYFSPESVVKQRSIFFLSKFLEQCKETIPEKPTTEQIYNLYWNWFTERRDVLETEYEVLKGDLLNLFGFKVSGSFELEREAKVRAKVLQKKNSLFDVIVAMLGKWLNGNPNVQNIKDQEFMNSEQNELMSNYRKNMNSRDELFEEGDDAAKQQPAVKQVSDEDLSFWRTVLELVEAPPTKEIPNIVELDEALKEKDYLDVDTPIPGQNWVSLFFIYPAKMIAWKELYFLIKAIQWMFTDQQSRDSLSTLKPEEITYDVAEDMFENWKVTNEIDSQDEFNQIVDYRTNVPSIKVSGCYESFREADVRSKVLDRKNNHMFKSMVGQVNYWSVAPFGDAADADFKDPNVVQTLNIHHNRLHGAYRAKTTNRNETFERNKEHQLEEAAKERTERGVEERPVSNEDAKKKVEELRGIADDRDRKLQEQIERSKKSEENSAIFTEDDPWMQRKKEAQQAQQVQQAHEHEHVEQPEPVANVEEILEDVL